MLKILIVDDQQTQRETLCRGLHLLGYQCVSAASSHEALEQLSRRTSQPFDLLLTDLTMPAESGLQLIQRALSLRPDLRVLVITGLQCSEDTRAARALGIPVLQKPFNPDQLQAAIRRMTWFGTEWEEGP